MPLGRHTIYEFDMMGKLFVMIKINNNYGIHHDVLELPNEDLLLAVGKRDAYIEKDGKTVLSDSDFMIHFDRKQSKIVREWDLAKHLDVDRDELNFFNDSIKNLFYKKGNFSVECINQKNDEKFKRKYTMTWIQFWSNYW